MACLRAAGQSVRKIAASVDRSPSTVARELKRKLAHVPRGTSLCTPTRQAHARWRGSRLERNSAPAGPDPRPSQRQGWSPEQVAGRLALETGKRVISHETIYRFIYLPNWRGRRSPSTPGVNPVAGTCPQQLRQVETWAAESVGEGTQPHSSLSAALLQNAPRRRMTGRPQDTGRPI